LGGKGKKILTLIRVVPKSTVRLFLGLGAAIERTRCPVPLQEEDEEKGSQKKVNVSNVHRSIVGHILFLVDYLRVRDADKRHLRVDLAFHVGFLGRTVVILIALSE
jgi:hypothetical protein